MLSGIVYISDTVYYVNISDTVLTNYPIPVNSRRMGRPPLNVKPTQVRLSEETRKRIEAVAGPSRMAAFIREAIEAELERREREIALPQNSQDGSEGKDAGL